MSKVAKENDAFRRAMVGRIFLTRTVSESPDKQEIVKLVREFKDFNKDNDPHGEHDFGSIILNEIKYFFKIDYYDDNLEYGRDPHTEQVVRVLTIMRADEY